MRFRRIIPAMLLTVGAAALLVGCTTTTSTGGNSGGTAGGPKSDGGADCSLFASQTDPALKLFTTDAIASGPKQGQKYGDGTELAVTLSTDAIAAGLLPQFELNKLSDDGPVSISSEIFDPTTGADGTYSTTNKLFGKDELVGKPMVLQVKYGDKVLLGNYCLSYANDGS